MYIILSHLSIIVDYRIYLFRYLQGEINSTSLKYRGCAWSKSKGTRTKINISNTPGPGRYNVNYNFCGKQKQNEKFRVLMRKCCNVPRVTCQLICRAKNEVRNSTTQQ